MIKSLDFYFDFISPYSYLAYKKIKKLKENEKIKVNYFPIVLGALHNLNGIKELLNLFSDSSFLILFWIHFLAINLFCGGWIVNDYQKFGISKILIFFPLIITYFVGPLGISIYWIIRIFYAKKINLYD